jgi:hypothetical protein
MADIFFEIDFKIREMRRKRPLNLGGDESIIFTFSRINKVRDSKSRESEVDKR